MAITINPLVPADTETPILGASRIRNLTAELLQILGQSGTGSVTYTNAPFIVDTTTGLVSLAGNATLPAQAVPLQQFVTTSAVGSGSCSFPGGLIVQFILSASIASGTPVTLPTAFTTSTPNAKWLALATIEDTSGVAVSVNIAGNNSVIPFFTGGGNRFVNIIAVGF